MVKNYVLDTNVLLQDPESIFNFEDNCVIVPIGVIEELDKFKKDITELGRNARKVSRSLDNLRKKGDLREGVPLEHGILKVRYNGNLESFYKEQNIDLHVIHIAQETIKREPNTPCIIVSNDVNIRIRANALGLQAEHYEANKIEHSDLDRGFSEVYIPDDIFDVYSSTKEYVLDDIKELKGFPPNYYLILKKQSDPKKSALSRINSDATLIKKIIAPPSKFPLTSKNKEQAFLLDALLDKNIRLVTVTGKAGSGKTILSIACGYYLTEIKQVYKRLLVSRPVFPMGRDLGYLPGTLEEKLDPWMQPIYDAFDVINQDKQTSGGRDVIKKSSKIVVEPLTYIRGRSIHDQFLVVDEAQNLTTLEIKTIITRAGENTKIVLTGDIYQIDNPYIDILSNGLSVVALAFKGSQLAANIVLDKGVRSELAEEASNKL
jgi:PhoH-like ATPase